MKNNKSYDLIIVGQGLAGINLSFEAIKRNLKVLHIHQSTIGESTKVAAGLINPITGRRFVKSWLIDQVMPFAEKRYKEFESLLGGDYISRLNIVRVFHQPEDENTWLAKSSDPYLAQFLMDKAEWMSNKKYHDKLNIPELIGELRDCFKINLEALQNDYLTYLETNYDLWYDTFDYSELEIHEDRLTYKDISTKKLIFAEGWKVLDNPFFEHKAFSPAKGELLIVRIPALKLDKAYKKRMFITPLGNDLYWVGATYEWKNFDPSPTDLMKNRVLDAFHEMINCPYEIVKHLTGIRPSSKDRRPVLGESPVSKRIHMFNGMGTKGSSLAPLFSEMLLDNMYNNREIMPEVHIDRFN